MYLIGEKDIGRLVGKKIVSVEYDEDWHLMPLKIHFDTGETLSVEAAGYGEYSLKLFWNDSNEPI